MTRQSEQKCQSRLIADAAQHNWVDQFAPQPVKPYLKLARWDRPTGFWLLFWPAAHSLGMAMMAKTFKFTGFDWASIGLLFVGAVAMRGAGCTLNDIVDKDIDARVARTQCRPLPAGDIGLMQAWLFLSLQCLVGLLVLIQFNDFTQLIALASLGLVAIYPFMKRITYWPQFFLGLCFGWGSLLGWAIVFGNLSLPALLLYVGTVSWIIGYDTIYALQDIEDDALIGVRSTALLFGDKVRWAVGCCYLTTILFWGWAGFIAGGGVFFQLGLAGVAGALTAQIWFLCAHSSIGPLRLFKANHWVGALFFMVLYIEFVF